MKKTEKKAVLVKVKDTNLQTRKSARFYLFDKEGQLIESVPLSKGQAKLVSKPEEIEGITLMMLGPDLPGEYDLKRLNPESVKKFGGTEITLHLNAVNELIITKIPQFKLPSLKRRHITGHLTKNFTVEGESKELPVCKARVHICEVDRLFLKWPRIPPFIVNDLAEKLRELLLRKKIKWPYLPVIDPHPDPWIVFNEIMKNEAIKGDLLDINPFPPGFKLPELPAPVKNGLLSPVKTTVIDTISKNFHLLHPYLCLWPRFWPWFYSCKEIGTVYTDNEGKFSKYYLDLKNDHDIYLWVEVFIDGHWVTVYRPFLPCGTHWDYACGTDIPFELTDPRVTPNCQLPVPGAIVWFKSIGEYASALHIEQDIDHAVSLQGVDFRNVGCTDVLKDPLTVSVAGAVQPRILPFGGALSFKLQFGDGLPGGSITHYRWKKTRIRDEKLEEPDLSDPPVTEVVPGTVCRYYYIITTDAAGHQHFNARSVQLTEGGGENTGHRIPKWNIMDDPGVPAADKHFTIEWTSPDFWSANFENKDLTDGLWRFDLELLSKDAAGNFHVVAVPKQVFQVSEKGNLWKSQDAPDDYLKISPLLIYPPRATALTLKVRIDNSSCQADIQDATIRVSGVDYPSGECGFLKYATINDRVNISFIATHPRNFGLFSFSIVKGNGSSAITLPAGSPPVNQAGYVHASAGGYLLSGSKYARNYLTSQLKGNCAQAAFAENLYIYALATNGTWFLRGYDASDTNAFALSNT